MQTTSCVMLSAAAVLITAIVGTSALNAITLPAAPPVDVSTARQDLPDGPGKAEVSKLCSECHDLMFTVSTRETEEGWTRIVNDMRSKGADGTEEQFAKIIAYLTTHMGKQESQAD